MKTPLAILALCGVLGAQTAGTIDRTKPPVTPAAPDYKLPATFETRLPNGLTVTLVEDQRFPLVTVRLGYLAGSKLDPGDMSGVSETVAALLTQGTTTRTAKQLAEEAASIGGQLSGSSTADGIVLGGSGLAEHTGKLLALLADTARNASFPEDELKLYGYSVTPMLYRQRYLDGAGKEGAFFVLSYAVGK
jgi:hypothetical protein